MADEAFALSPISARAAQPREEDYDAISEAFMETSRGRWFLGEYAKRNRNADTRMVLDAVARIEETLVAQRQPVPETDNGLAETLAAIASSVEEARAAGSAAFDSLALEENLAPIRKGARVIREIAWRLREIGADGRICDLIDSQVGAIEAAYGKISSSDPQVALSAAFDLIKQRIGEFGDGDTASPQGVEEAMPSPSAAAPDEESPTAATAETVPSATATNDAEAAAGATAMPAEAVVATEAVVANEAAAATTETVAAETVVTEAVAADTVADATVADATVVTETIVPEAVVVTAEAPDVTAEAAGPTGKASDVAAQDADAMTAEAAQPYDDALLDLIAIEMAAPVPAETDALSDTNANAAEIAVAAISPADSEIIAPATAQPPAVQASLQASMPSSAQPSMSSSVQASLQPSLGSTLIASGIVRKPTASRPDPFAPIRRMSQAERIAFFS